MTEYPWPMAVTWVHEKSLWGLPSPGVRVRIWHCQTKNFFLCLITQASSRRFCPTVDRSNTSLVVEGRPRGLMACWVFLPVPFLEDVPFPCDHLRNPRVLSGSPTVSDGTKMRLAAVP